MVIENSRSSLRKIAKKELRDSSHVDVGKVADVYCSPGTTAGTRR